MSKLEYCTTLDVSRDQLFAWHVRPGALERLLPPWQDVRVVDHGAGVADGSQITLSVPVGPARTKWVARHFDVQPPLRFRDEQVSGPFHRWTHSHLFEEAAGGSQLVDQIEYSLPLGAAGAMVGGSVIRHMLDRMFRFRHQRTRQDLARHAISRDKPPLRILIAGASGLIGSVLCPFLTTGGHTVVQLVRRPAKGEGEIQWDPASWQLDAGQIEGFDAVINLSGKTIASGRWTEETKRQIVSSRTQTTRLLSERIAALSQPPRVLINASAVGFYGNRGEERLTEESRPGEGFLADTASQWEAATRSAQEAGIRVVLPRFASILSTRGGALAALLTPFRLGLGGRVGSGQQRFPWVALDDVLGAINQCLFDSTLSGPVNVAAPECPTNEVFGQTLARVLSRPAIAPLPEAAVKLMFGQMGEELLLSGNRPTPAKLQAAGFQFNFPFLEDALRWELGKV